MIIDHTDKLELSEEETERYYHESNLLNTLATGLDFLNRQVANLEGEARDRLNANDDLVVSFGNDPRLKGIPRRLISCTFRWYSVTACDYVRIIGWLVNGGNTKKASDYLDSVIPQVRIWRNKVGAHSAFTDPKGDDTPANLFVSSIPWDIGFVDDAFVAGSITVSLGSDDGGSTSRQDMEWSLTRIHRQLACRYAWPS